MIIQNWQWDGKVEVPNRPKIREAASIHVKAGDTSTITYLMPMAANSRGYEPTLEVHLDTVSVTTSLNDIRLLQAGSCRVRCLYILRSTILMFHDRSELIFLHLCVGGQNVNGLLESPCANLLSTYSETTSTCFLTWAKIGLPVRRATITPSFRCCMR